MNSDTATTQWGQDEEVLLIEPDRGEDRKRGREEEEGERITCDSPPFLSAPRPCMAEGRGEGRGEEGSQ